MKPEEHRIAIAEACGWKGIYKGSGSAGYYGLKQGNHRTFGIPDYLGSLDAMHQAFGCLTTIQKIKFHIHLETVSKSPPCPKLGSDFDYKVSNATAAQRAEAFLRTLNLWTE